MRRRTRRGFTLVEMMICIGIVGILIAASIPLISGGKRRSDMNRAARDFINNVHWVRTLAVSQTAIPTAGFGFGSGGGGSGGGGSGGGGGAIANQFVHSAGLTIVSPTQYSIFVDNDDYAGNETTMAIVDLSVTFPGTGITIVAPAVGDTLRLKRNATLLAGGVPPVITIQDTTGMQKTLRISANGMPKLIQ